MSKDNCAGHCIKNVWLTIRQSFYTMCTATNPKEKAMLTILLTSAVFAQAPETNVPSDQITYAKETIIDFEPGKVEGQIVDPGVALIEERPVVGIESLIQLRTTFQPEMTHSIEMIK